MRLASILLMCLAPLAVAAQDRQALVVGIGGYETVAELEGPRGDARAVGAALEDLEFEVTTLIDPAGEELKQEIADFGFRSETAEIAVVYYAGHRLSVDGRNYLIPADGPLAPAKALQKRAVSLPSVMRAAGKAREMRIVVLDDCRTAPLQVAMPMTPPEPRAGTLVLTSGRAGACDPGTEAPGLFAEVLIDAFAQEDVEIGVALDRLRADLRRRSGGALAPRRFGRLHATPYFLDGGPERAASTAIDGDRVAAWSGLNDAQAAEIGELAARGDTRALLASAYLRLDPDSARHDPERAARDLERAARTGSDEARFQLARLHEDGQGVSRDPERALALYEEAAARGYGPALNDLGFIYLQGELGVEADPDRAQDYFRRAADRRHPGAMFNYAALIDDGKVEARGAPDAALYLYRALRGGDATLLDLMTNESELFNSETRKALQRRLARRGFYDGPIDGDYGPGTQAGIRAAYGGPEAAATGDSDAEESVTVGETAQEGEGEDAAEPAGAEESAAEAPAAESEPEADTDTDTETPEAVRADATPEPGLPEDTDPVLRPKLAPRE